MPDIRDLLKNPHVVRSMVLACLLTTCVGIMLWCVIGCCCSRAFSRRTRREAGDQENEPYEMPPRNMITLPKIMLERTVRGARRLETTSKGVSRAMDALGLHPESPIRIEPGELKCVRIGWRVQVPTGHMGFIWGASTSTGAGISDSLMVCECHLSPGWTELSVTVFNPNEKALDLAPESAPFAYLRVERTPSFTVVQISRTNNGGRPKKTPSTQTTPSDTKHLSVLYRMGYAFAGFIDYIADLWKQLIWQTRFSSIIVRPSLRPTLKRE